MVLPVCRLDSVVIRDRHWFLPLYEFLVRCFCWIVHGQRLEKMLLFSFWTECYYENHHFEFLKLIRRCLRSFEYVLRPHLLEIDLNYAKVTMIIGCRLYVS